MADIEITQAIKAHIEKYDTPKADDPRRRYTVAQLETAIQAAIAQQIEKDAGIAERWDENSPYSSRAAAIRAQADG